MLQPYCRTVEGLNKKKNYAVKIVFFLNKLSVGYLVDTGTLYNLARASMAYWSEGGERGGDGVRSKMFKQ